MRTGSQDLPVWVVDSFTDRPFSGNPAAVCILDSDVADPWLQAFAAEMRHSETSFLVQDDGGWRLRWFTPAREVDLCGHATLAAAHVLWETGRVPDDQDILFHTRSGTLRCWQADGRIWMRLPSMPASPADAPSGLVDALGLDHLPAPPRVLLAANGNYLLVLEDPSLLEALRPDFRALGKVSDRHGFIVTAATPGAEHDVSCRYFVPAWGIDEDPVTGSIQATIGPYWAARLGRQDLIVSQRSPRRGTLRVRMGDGSVDVGGTAVTVLAGQVAIGASDAADPGPARRGPSVARGS